jgi:hypothetical protein
MLIPHEQNLFSDSINNEEEKESDLASINVSLKKHPAANSFSQASAVKRRDFFVYHRWEKRRLATILDGDRGNRRPTDQEAAIAKGWWKAGRFLNERV